MNLLTKMKYKIKQRSFLKCFALYIILFFCSTQVTAQSIHHDSNYYRASVGPILGSYNGLYLKVFVFEDVAVGIDVGSFAFAENLDGKEKDRSRPHISLVLKHHSKTKHEKLYKYFGAGFITALGEGNSSIGLKTPIGLEINSSSDRFKFFGEVSPIIFYENDFSNAFSSTVSKKAHFTASFNIGFRFVFLR